MTYYKKSCTSRSSASLEAWASEKQVSTEASFSERPEGMALKFWICSLEAGVDFLSFFSKLPGKTRCFLGLVLHQAEGEKCTCKEVSAALWAEGTGFCICVSHLWL